MTSGARFATMGPADYEGVHMLRDVVLPLIDLGLLIFCLIDCIQTPDGAIRNLPKWGWLVLIIIVPLVGPIAWLFAGRPERGASSGMPYRGNTGKAPWPSGPTAGYPEYQRPPRGPDDDTEFLSKLKRADNEHEDVLKRWEADLRRREDELKGKDGDHSADDGEDPTTR